MMVDTASANRANQNNQFGSVNWSRDPASGNWTQTESYNPEQQSLLSQRTANQGVMGQKAGGMLSNFDGSYANAPAAGQVGGFNQQATDLYDQLAQPGLDRQRSSKEAQMAAMGLNLGSGRAWDTEQENLNRSEDLSGMMGAQAGITQGNQMFAQQNALRGQYTGEQNQILHNAGGMMDGSAPKDLEFGSYYNQKDVASPQYAALGEQQRVATQNANNAAAAKKKGMLGGYGKAIGTGVGAYFNNPEAGAAIGGALDS